MATGEVQMGNLPLIMIAIAIICIGVLGFLEMKKLYIKLNVITNKLDELNETISKAPEKTEEKPTQAQPRMIHPGQIPPHIQHQMMLRRQQEELHMMRQNEAQRNQRVMEDNVEYEEKEEERVDDDDDIIEESLSDNESKEDDDIVSNSVSNSENNDIENEEENNDEEDIEIGLDNEYKHLSVKELKELCIERNLQVSGNKSKLISRLMENN